MKKLDNIIDAAMGRIDKATPKSSIDPDLIKKKIEKFITDVSNDSACQGIVIQLSLAQPLGAKGLVTSIHMSFTALDSQAAVDSLSRKPNPILDKE